MLYIIIPFAVWMLISIFLAVRNRNELIPPMFIITGVPIYLIAIIILGILGFNIPTNPSIKVDEIALTNLHGDTYVGSSKNNNFYIYAIEDGSVHALKRFDGIDVYIKETTENFRIEHWASYITADALPSRAYYIFYVPENGVCIIN